MRLNKFFFGERSKLVTFTTNYTQTRFRKRHIETLYHRSPKENQSVNLISKFLGIDKSSKSQQSMQRALNPKPVLVKGEPVYVTEKQGNMKSVSRRMNMLNRHFLECITDAIAQDDISKDFRQLDIQITEVSVLETFVYCNIYWTTSRIHEIYEITKKLKDFTPSIYRKVIEKNFMTKTPQIRFLYDKRHHELQRVHDLMKLLGNTNNSKMENLQPHNETEESEIEEETETVSPHYVLKHPTDMRMDVLNLNYKELMSIVLSTMKKARAQHRYYPAVADPLPPAEWIAPPEIHIGVHNEEYLDSETRIIMMKKFIIENRKKRQRITKEARKKEILSKIFHELQQEEAEEIFYENNPSNTEDYSEEDYEESK